MNKLNNVNKPGAFYGERFFPAGLFLFLIFTMLFGACASTPPKETESAAESLTPETKPPAQPARIIPGDGLDGAAFRDLPLEAKDYLELLAEAFREKDGEFIAAQGEAQFERELRGTLEEETYIALLYRAGTLSEESGWRSLVPPRLDYKEVLAITYTLWEEAGPLIKINGRLYFENGDILPCEIMLVWRLEEPKILGAYPR